jgi:hypothetical protein
MAEYQKIEFLIGQDGKVTEKVLNGSGETCTLATVNLEASLGEIESRDLLPEYGDIAENNLVMEQSQTLQQQG